MAVEQSVGLSLLLVLYYATVCEPPSKEDLLNEILPQPRRTTWDDIELVFSDDGSPIVLGTGVRSVVKLVVFKPRRVLAALKIVKEETRDSEFTPTLLFEAAVSELIRRSDGYTAECYGVIGAYAAIYELVAMPDSRDNVSLVGSTLKSLLWPQKHGGKIRHPKSGGKNRWMVRRNSLSPVDWLRICCQLAATLDVLHRHRLAHRDIESDNVLVAWPSSTRSTVSGLLTDFTLTGPIQLQPHRYRNCGYRRIRRAYRTGLQLLSDRIDPKQLCVSAPETNRDDRSRWLCNTENDVWHLGKEFGAIVRKTSAWSLTALRNIVGRMMDDDPRERPTAAEVKMTLTQLLRLYDQDPNSCL